MLLCPLLIAGLTAVAPLQAPEMTAHFIDVGQGNAALLEFPCGTVLIDAGAQDNASERRLMRYLEEFFAERPDRQETIDVVFITHPHRDHTYALRDIAERFRIRNYVDDGLLEGSGGSAVRWIRERNAELDPPVVIREVRHRDISGLRAGGGLSDEAIDPIRCETCDPRIRVLEGQRTVNPGWNGTEFSNPNNHSLVIRADFGQSSFLFTGDLEEPAIEALVEDYERTETLDVDVWLVGHHGSQNGVTGSLMAAMTPAMAVISVGEWDYGKDSHNPFTTWRFGHPRDDALALLGEGIVAERSPERRPMIATGSQQFVRRRIHKAIYATAWDGTILVRGRLDAEPELLPAP
ncbi:MAG: MBL fold metallo-hydrolase [Planctomycetota bacterium]|nr:MAG: MBL fold metallo-hydrolase [Planctomycetota bacterium]